MISTIVSVAFANDYNNDGGGYIVVGVEEEMVLQASGKRLT